LTVLPACSIVPKYFRHTDPLTSEEHLRLGATYEVQGLKENAREQYEAAVRLQNSNTSALMALGNLVFNHGDDVKAEGLYRQVLALDPLHAGANNNMAVIALHRKDAKTAEPYALTALAQGGPLKPYVLETLACIYMEQERLDEARESLDEAEMIAPADHQALLEQLRKTREKLNAQASFKRGG